MLRRAIGRSISIVVVSSGAATTKMISNTSIKLLELFKTFAPHVQFIALSPTSTVANSGPIALHTVRTVIRRSYAGGGITPKRYHPARRACIGSLPSTDLAQRHQGRR
jgi:hypothetical protein